MKEKLIYWFKFARNVVDTTLLIYLVYTFIMAITKTPVVIVRNGEQHLYIGSSDFLLGFWSLSYLYYYNLNKYYFDIVSIPDKYIWHFYFEILLLVTPLIIFTILELKKRKLLFFKDWEIYKAKKKEKRKIKLQEKLKKLGYYEKNY